MEILFTNMPSNQNIHLTLIQDLFSEYGIRNISMDDIARNLHISKKTIYKQYTNKDELIKDIYINDYYHFKASLHSLDKENNDAISKTIQLYNIVLLKIRPISKYVYYDLAKYYPDFLNQLIELYNESIRLKFIQILFEGKRDNYFHINIKSNSVAHIFSILIKTYVFNKILEHKTNPLIDFDDVFDYHFGSICSLTGISRWEELKKQSLLSEHP